MCDCSSEFCEKHLPLLFTILEKSSNPVVRANAVIALGDLTFRFPNLIEPWTSHVYARLVVFSLLIEDEMNLSIYVTEFTKAADTQPKNVLLANICVTHDNILLDNSMAEMADSADDNDVAAAVICLIARK